MSELPVSNIINVSLTGTPSGLAERNVNSLAIFTTDPMDSFEPYEIVINSKQGAELFGTNTETARMINAVFAQTPNIRSGNGRLVLIPLLNSVSATPGFFTSANIAANIAAIAAVTNGDLRVTLGGVNYDLTNLNFSGATTLANIATVLGNKLPAAAFEASGNTIIVRNKKVGTAATVALAAVPSGTGTNLAAAGLLNTAAGASTAGVNSSGETLLAALARTEGLVSYVPFMTNLNIEDSVFAATAAAVQATDHMFLHHFASIADIAGAATVNKSAGNTKTRPLLYSLGLSVANIEKAAYAGRGFSVNFRGSNTSQTMNLKQLATITPDLGVTQTNYINADTAGIDLYVSYAGVPSVFSTGGNDYFDNPYSDLALKFALETEGFNFLRQTNTKVPQTEEGMNGLKNAYAQVCERFIRNDCIAPGRWTSSETFGDPETFRQNIESYGFYIYSLPIVEQDAAEREIRKAPLVQIAIKRAGAIHTSDVIVVIND